MIHITAKAFVDCSGNSVISHWADLPFIESVRHQAAAQVFSLQHLTETNEARLGMILIKELRTAIDQGKLPAYFDRVYVVPGSLKNNGVSLKIGIPLDAPAGIEQTAVLKNIASTFITELVNYLTAEVIVFKNARLVSIAPEVGIRASWRATGKYILTGQDVLTCKKFEDAIANGSWPIEEWTQNRRVNMEYFRENDHYQVPAGCLQSVAAENLFMAGKNISATDRAIASARVIGTCLQTGYAAGCLAAGYINKEDLSNVIDKIRREQIDSL